MWLKYLGISGPNGEQKHEVREYKDEEAKYLLQAWPHHFAEAEDDEIPEKKKPRRKKSE